MKKTIILFLFISCSIGLFAQEKQNDATWEETISFLQENIGTFNRTEKGKYKDGEYKSIHDYAILGGTFKELEKTSNIEVSVRLENLKSCSLFKNTDSKELSIVLNFEKNTVSVQDNNGIQKKGKIYIGMCSLLVENSNDVFVCQKSLFNADDLFFKRMVKAFKHLAYLANKKRKKSKF